MRLLAVLILAFSCIPVFAAPKPSILVLGDSLSAGYGLDRVDQGWVSLLQQRLQAENYPHRVVNASVSGDTTSNGLARLDRSLATHRPELVVIELGGNDGLRGLSLGAMRENLVAMVEASRAAGARVLLLGMRLPPNYGMAYTRAFERVYRRVADQLQVDWVPFFLEGVAENRDLMQPDGIHPTAAAQPVMLDHVYPEIERLLQSIAAGQPATVTGGG